MVLGLLAALLSGCPTDEVVEDDDDFAGLDVDPTLELSEIVPTVATVSWTLADPDATAQVSFGRAEDEPFMAPAEVDGGVATATLIGMKPETDYTWVVSETVNGETVEAEPATLTTGSLPNDMPELFVETLADGSFEGFILVSLITSETQVVIVDSDGDYVWWRVIPTEDQPHWQREYVPKAILSQDREIVFLAKTSWDDAGGDTHVHDFFVYSELDGTVRQTIDSGGAHHDFTELPDGTLAILMADVRTVGDEEVLGDRLIERDTDGNDTDIWTVWDDIFYDPEFEHDAGTGWTHANTVEYVPEANEYYVGLRNFNGFRHIDRATGDQLSVIGGDDSDYALEGGSTVMFDRQHQIQVLDDTIVVFDNRLPDVGAHVLEYRLHDDTGLAEVAWEYIADPPLFSIGFGDVHRLDNGNTLIDWSGAGEINEVTPDGEVIWTLNMDLGSGLSYMQYLPSLY